MLISNKSLRDARANQKRNKLLQFLADEIWSTVEILRLVVDVADAAPVRRSLLSMEKQGLVRQYEIGMKQGGPSVRLWGITTHGLLMAGEGELILRNSCDSSKISFSAIPHQIALQKARIAAEKAGWLNWIRGERLRNQIVKRPDALVKNSSGYTVAVEVELTAKTSKRYQQVLGDYLVMARNGDINRVAYLCERNFGQRLKRLLTSQKAAYYQLNGQRGRIDLQPNHFSIFDFYDIAGWPAESSKI